MKRYRYQALVTLYLPQQGGLETPLPPQTRCLVVRAQHRDTRQPKLFSSVVTADDDRPLQAGDRHRLVCMQVNGDDAKQYVGPGEHFDLWYGTDVGHGVVARQMFTGP